MAEKERLILTEEFEQDYETYDRIRSIKDLIMIGLTGISMLVTIFGIFYSKVSQELYYGLVIYITCYAAGSVIAITCCENCRSGNMNLSKYLLDILTNQGTKKSK